MNTIKPVIISSFGPPSLACIRSWGRKGMEPGMVTILNPGETAASSRYLSGSCVLPRNQLYTEDGLAVIINFLSFFKATGLFCIDEKVSIWLNDNKQDLPKDTILWLPTNEMIQRSLPKIHQIDVARKVGLEVLPTYLFSSVADTVASIPADVFPLCLRPSTPDSVAPVFKVQNVQSIDELRDFLEKHEIKAPVIGQPFLNLPNLVVHGARTLKGETTGLQGFLVERKFQGVTLTIRPVALEDDLMRKCIAFTDEMDLVGHYHFEFLYDSTAGKRHFLEFNHRFGGTTAKVLACGYDEPAYALQAYGIGNFTPAAIKNVTASSMKALVKSTLYAMSDRLTPLDFPEESKSRRLYFTLKSLLFCRDEIFAWDDMKGTWTLYFG